MPDKDEDKVKSPPKNLKILRGFKATAETVPYFYEFNQWYHRQAHVLPRILELIKADYGSYEGALYECEYAGIDEKLTAPFKFKDSPFVIAEYIKVFPGTCSVVVLYDGRVKIGGKLYKG